MQSCVNFYTLYSQILLVADPRCCSIVLFGFCFTSGTFLCSHPYLSSIPAAGQTLQSHREICLVSLGSNSFFAFLHNDSASEALIISKDIAGDNSLFGLD